MSVPKGRKMKNGSIPNRTVSSLLDKLGLSDYEIAERLEVDYTTVYNWRRTTTLKAVVAYALIGLQRVRKEHGAKS